MANKSSKAEQYRDERKARIAKTAKKNAKNMEAKNTAKKLAGKIISIVLAAAIALGAAGSILNYYGIWQRTLKIGGVGSEVKVSVAEYEFYYIYTYNNLIGNLQQASSYYGQSYGYDFTLGLDQQTSTTQGPDGKEISWAEYVKISALNQLKQVNALYNEAVKAGYTLSDGDKKIIDESIESYKEQAASTGTASDGSAQPGYSVGAYARKSYGNFMNVSLLRKMLEKQLIAQNYQTNEAKELAEGYDQAKIDKIYKADKDAYDLVDLCIYTFTTKELEAKENESKDALKDRQAKADAEVKKNAEAFLAAVKDEKTFINKAKEANKDNAEYDASSATNASASTKETLEQNYSEDVAKWAFNNGTKVGAKKLFTDKDNGSYTIALLTKGRHQVKTADVRHILFMTTDDSTGKPLSDEEIAKAKANAEAAVKAYNEGKKTEESFAALATDLTEDTGSASTGGLYEDIAPDAQLVDEFKSWALGAHKPGDVEIIESQYGYHVMYYVGEGSDYYDSKIRKAEATKDLNEKTTALLEGESYEIGFGPRRMAYAEKTVNKKINNLIERSNSSKNRMNAAQ